MTCYWIIVVLHYIFAFIRLLSEDILWITCMVLPIILLPYAGNINTLRWFWLKRKNEINSQHEFFYNYADDEIQDNPLFRKGYLRKTKHNSFVLSKIRGIFVCQIITGILLILNYMCIFVYEVNSPQRKLYEYLIIISSIVIFVIWFFVVCYYMHYYRKNYAYVENENGIWLPFTGLTEFSENGLDFSSFQCQYITELSEFEKNIASKTQDKNYEFITRFTDEIDVKFYVKKEHKNLKIFAYIFLEEYCASSNELLNRFFVEFCKQNKFSFDKTYSLDLIILFCIEKENEYLKKHFLYGCMEQKKGRHRLVAVWNKQTYSFRIVGNNTKEICNLAHKKMKRDLMELLSLDSRCYGTDVYLNDRIAKEQEKAVSIHL